MPAKKKSVPKKSAAKKTSATKSTPSSKKKAPDSARPEASDTEASTAKKTKASDVLQRSRKNKASVVKPTARKHAPVVFTLEDAREILKRRKSEEEPETPRSTRPVSTTEGGRPSAAAIEELSSQKSKHGAASLADILGFGAGLASPKQSANSPAPEAPKKFRKYHALLLELRQHVQQSLGMHAEDTLKRSQKEDSGDISTSSDAGTDNFDRDFALSVVSSEQEALREIEAAIKRIFNGTYGICEITGETISPERLEAVPFTRFSLEGQRQHELTARRRVQRGGTSFLSEGGEIAFGGDDDGDN